MQAEATRIELERDSLIDEIIALTNRGLTDQHIGHLLGKHHKTIMYHRKRHGIASGRSHKAALSEPYRKLTTNKRSYKMFQESPCGGKIKHGLNSYAPITCTGSRCPYRETCDIPAADLVAGIPCVKEIALVVTLFARYCDYFQPGDDDTAALTKIRHLVDIEVKQIRCNRLMSVKPILYVTEDERGNVRKTLNPLCDYELLLIEAHRRVLRDVRALTGVV